MSVDLERRIRINAEHLQKMLTYLDDLESKGFTGMVMANFFAHWMDDIRQLANEALVAAPDSNAVAAFQRLPADLAKLLNYGAPLNAEMLNALASAWNQKSSPQCTIPDNELLEKIALTLCLANCPACNGDATKCAYGIENYGVDAKQVLETIRPYLRSPAQVPKP